MNPETDARVGDGGGSSVDADPGKKDATDAPGGDVSPDLSSDRTSTPEVSLTCGNDGQVCCPGNVCQNGGCCVNGRCAANGTACRSDATCLNGSCGGCGGPPNPSPQLCCESRVCTASRTLCTGAGQGVCQICGSGGQPCCDKQVCDPGFICDPNQGPSGVGQCVACGR